VHDVVRVKEAKDMKSERADKIDGQLEFYHRDSVDGMRTSLTVPLTNVKRTATEEFVQVMDLEESVDTACYAFFN